MEVPSVYYANFVLHHVLFYRRGTLIRGSAAHKQH